MSDCNIDELAIDKLLKYVNINTVQPKPNYSEVVQFMKEYSAEIPILEFCSEILPSGFPYILLTWPSSDRNLPGILLNSHMDVVPFDETKWIDGKPFGSRNANGRIYGRGTQDMKSLAIQQMESVRRLHHKGFKPKRSIYILLVPDEEVGGIFGMAQLIKTSFFDDHNIGCALDEGMPSPDCEYIICCDERYPYWLNFTFNGDTGHGSLPNSMKYSSEKFRTTLNHIYQIHDSEIYNLKEPVSLKNLGNIITANLTKVNGGIQTNVIPSKIEATFDVRVPPSKNAMFIEQLDMDIPGVELDFNHPVKSRVSKEVDRWANKIKEVMSEMNLDCDTVRMPGTTDMRYVRSLGIPAIGFSPLNNTEIKLHDHDEYVDESVFCNGIDIYMNILQKLTGNLEI